MRPIETPRAQAGARAMEDASTELGQQLGAAVGQPMWARLYGLRVLEADDAHGHGEGLVVQHDHLRWADLLAVAAFAAPRIDPEQHPAPACRDIPGGCPACRAQRALARLRTAWFVSGLDLGAVNAAASISAAGLGTPPAGHTGEQYRTDRSPGLTRIGAPMPPILLARPDSWLIEDAPSEWPRPPDPHPSVSLVAWGWVTRAWAAGYVSWTDVDSWMARSRGGRLAPQVLYTRWVPSDRLRPAAGIDYQDVRRLRLTGRPDGWPAPAVGPDGEPWYGIHRVHPPVPELADLR